MLVKELKKLAREYKIPGRSKMNKEELEKAINNISQQKEFDNLAKGKGVVKMHDLLVHEKKKELNNRMKKKSKLPKNDCPGDYTRKELEHIARDCGIKNIYKKNMSQLCGEIVKTLEKTGEVWKQEKRKRGKKTVVHHIRDVINISPIKQVDDKIDIFDDDKIDILDDKIDIFDDKIDDILNDKIDIFDDKIIQNKDIPNHGKWPIHEDEYKTCQVFSNCTKEYSKKNLLDLAVKCGVNIHERGKKTKTKVKLCNALKKKYGSKQKPKLDRKRDEVIEIKLGEELKLLDEVENFDWLQPKYYPNDLLRYLRNLGFIVPDHGYVSPQRVYIPMKKRPKRKSPKRKVPKRKVPKRKSRREIEMQLDKKDRNCLNAHDLMQYSIDDMETETFIKTADGYCYDVNDLVQFLIVNHDRNSDPIENSKKIWNDDMEKATILSHPGLEKEMLDSYYKMLENVQQEKLKRLEIMWDQRNVLQQIGETGFICLNDQFSEFGDEGFDYSARAIDRLYKTIEKLHNKPEWRKLRGGRIELGQVLDDIPNTCVHGTGFKLSYLFSYFQTELKKEIGKYVENELYFPISNCPYTLSFHINTKRIQDLPDISDSNENEFTICYYETDESTERDFGINEYGRTGAILKRDKVFVKDKYILRKLKCDVKTYLTSDLWKQFNSAAYRVFDKYKIGKS